MDDADYSANARYRGGARLASYGAGELAEIAVSSAPETALEVVCVVDPTQAGHRCAGLARESPTWWPGKTEVLLWWMQARWINPFTDTHGPGNRFDEATI